MSETNIFQHDSNNAVAPVGSLQFVVVEAVVAGQHSLIFVHL
jgi:hypothetical protein